MKKAIKIFLFFSGIYIIIWMMAFHPIIATVVVVAEVVWRKYGIPRLIKTLPDGTKQMPLLVPWICIPIPFTYVKWRKGYIEVNSPLRGYDPTTYKIAGNVKSDWQLLAKIRGTTILVYTNAMMDWDFYHSKKGIRYSCIWFGVAIELVPEWKS